MSLVWLANIPDYEEFPLQQPPPGLKANFINPETNAYQVYVVSAVCIVLVCISAGIRFTVKAFYLKVRTRDDSTYSEFPQVMNCTNSSKYHTFAQL